MSLHCGNCIVAQSDSVITASPCSVGSTAATNRRSAVTTVALMRCASARCLQSQTRRSRASARRTAPALIVSSSLQCRGTGKGAPAGRCAPGPPCCTCGVNDLLAIRLRQGHGP